MRVSRNVPNMLAGLRINQSKIRASTLPARSRDGGRLSIFLMAFGYRANGRLIGGCGFLNDNGKAQIGYVLGVLHWGNGYATEASVKLIGMLKKQSGIFRIGSFVDADNLASAKVLIKAGLVEEAVLQNWFQFPNQENATKDCILFKLPDLGNGCFSGD
jgi:RimJ/RimL family protein N-acetyltransferase